MLDGLLVAFLNIDEVIRIIRHEEQPRSALMERFGLSEVQADAVLNLRLRQLARLEEIRIRGEQQELADERDALSRLLKSATRLRTLIKDEILELARRHGDARRTAVVKREAAQAIPESALVASEPVTVVLSARGWVRAARGHDIDAVALAYKSGDGYLTLARGRSTQLAVFLDSTGRAYCLPAHTLPSARGQGEPLTGRLNPPAGASFRGVMLGEPTTYWLVASDAGYGFFVRLGDLHSRVKAGKACLRVPEGGDVLLPVPFPADADFPGDCRVAVASSEGRLLVFPAADLPALARGKGNKLFNVSAQKFRAGREKLVAVAVLRPADALVVISGQRSMTIKPADLAAYAGGRAQRGALLPRGWQRVERLQLP